MALSAVSKRRMSAIAIGVAISAGFVVFIFSKVDLARIGQALGSVRIGLLACSLISTLAGFFAMTARSRVLMSPMTVVPLSRLFRSVLLGFAGNNVLPLRAGEFMRIDYLARHTGCRHSAVLAVVAVERLLDLLCLALLFVSALSTTVMGGASADSLPIIVAVVLVGLTAMVLVSRFPEQVAGITRRCTAWLGDRISSWVTQKTELFSTGLSALRSPLSVLGAVGSSALYWACSLVTTRIWLSAFGLRLPWYAPGVIVVFIALGVTVPSSPAFIGTYHYFAMLALGRFGVDTDVAASFALVGHATAMVPFTAVALMLMFGEMASGGFRAFHRGRPGEDSASPAAQS